MSNSYPQYRLSQWLDTSEDAMAEAFGTILYGIETKRHKGGQWLRCMTKDGPILFKTRDSASDYIDKLKANDKPLLPRLQAAD